MATDYKIVVVPDTGGTRPCIECPQCLGLQLLYILCCISKGVGLRVTADFTLKSIFRHVLRT